MEQRDDHAGIDPVAVPLGVIFGIAVRHCGLALAVARARCIMPVLDLMQTIPVFAYLVPVLFLFGFGPTAASSLH
jgi:glycine betaine/proline transport system permease protein